MLIKEFSILTLLATTLIPLSARTDILVRVGTFRSEINEYASLEDENRDFILREKNSILSSIEGFSGSRNKTERELIILRSFNAAMRASLEASAIYVIPWWFDKSIKLIQNQKLEDLLIFYGDVPTSGEEVQEYFENCNGAIEWQTSGYGVAGVYNFKTETAEWKKYGFGIAGVCNFNTNEIEWQTDSYGIAGVFVCDYLVK